MEKQTTTQSSSAGVGGQESDLPATGWKPEVYKTTNAHQLQLWHKAPAQGTDEQPAPAIVFFYGGGWINRNIVHFRRQADHLVSLGMHAILADYRSSQTYGGTPFDCVEDAKSAMRYIRRQAQRWGIDPTKLTAAGGSAGGHLAACTALVPGLNAVDDPDECCVPQALVLFNPVYDNSPDGYGHDRIQERWPEISPMHHIQASAPPNIVFLGTEDHLVPVPTAKEWQAQMQANGVRSELHLYEGGTHGFFNHGSAYQDTLEKTIEFLASLNFLPRK